MKGFCNGTDLLFHLLIIFACQHKGKIDVVTKTESVQKVEILEYEAQVFPAKCGNLFFCQMGDAFSFQKNFTGCGAIQGCQNVQKRCFSGTGLSHDRHIFPLFHRKGHIGKCLYFVSAKAGAVYLFYICYFQ